MARPIKQGVDYFPLDVHLDNKFKFVEIKYGIEGFGIVVKIMQNIYSQGYWTNWGEDEQLLFAADNRIDFGKLEGVVNECLKRGVFNAEMFEMHAILTSNGIQKRYKEIVRRRKEVTIIDDYLLIDSINAVNDDINSVDADSVSTEGSHDDGKSTQRKVKESKGNETKEEKTAPHVDYEFEFEEFYKIYIKKVDKKKAFDKFKTLRKKHSFETIYKGTENYMKYCQINKTDKQFIKGPAVFLNGENFNDEFDLTPPSQFAGGNNSTSANNKPRSFREIAAAQGGN